MKSTNTLDHVEVTSSEELRAWLLENHSQKESVWLVTYKKSTPEKYVSVQEILDELIAFGWIDGIRRKTDPKLNANGKPEERTMQLIAPRSTQHWAKSYKDRAAKLQNEGRMHEAGRAALARSKKNGLWNFMDDVDALITPQDLQAELDRHDGAAAFFHALSASAKRFTLRWIKLAKTDTTRRKRLVETAKRSAAGEFVKGVRM